MHLSRCEGREIDPLTCFLKLTPQPIFWVPISLYIALGHHLPCFFQTSIISNLFHRIFFFHCHAYSSIPNAKNFLFKSNSFHFSWDQSPGNVVYNHCLQLLINILLEIFNNLFSVSITIKKLHFWRLPTMFLLKPWPNTWFIQFVHPYSSKLSVTFFFRHSIFRGFSPSYFL